MLNLDTHILVFALTGELTTRERRLLVANNWAISAIVLWEMAKLAQLGRIEVDLDSGEVARTLASLTVLPLDMDVARQSTRLDFRGDPADEIIGATSIVHQIPLLTRNKELRASRIVPLA